MWVILVYSGPADWDYVTKVVGPFGSEANCETYRRNMRFKVAEVLELTPWGPHDRADAEPVK